MTALQHAEPRELRALLPGTASFVPRDERVLLVRRPSAWWILTHRWRVMVYPALLLMVVWVLWRQFTGQDMPVPLNFYAVGWTALILAYQFLAWLSRLYVLTERRLIAVAGIIARDVGDVPLRNVQHEVITQSPAERALGLGTVGVATAGSDGPALRWLSVPRPDRVLSAIRGAVEKARRGLPAEPRGPAVGLRLAGALYADEPAPKPAPEGGRAEEPAPRGEAPAPAPRTWVPVIGLAGGIGAGKSAVARAFEALGCVVIDSDREARAALDRPEVRERLVDWWGPRVLSEDGRINRKAVADIVFAAPLQRRRLEELVHPLVRARRADLKARAEAAGAAGVIVDAPLLFEAGVDAECDAVVFVDAPREQRLDRVRQTRGWDDAELSRREASQMPLADKRARSNVVVVNDSTPEDLGAAVAEAFRQILAWRPAAGPAA